MTPLICVVPRCVRSGRIHLVQRYLSEGTTLIRVATWNIMCGRTDDLSRYYEWSIWLSVYNIHVIDREPHRHCDRVRCLEPESMYVSCYCGTFSSFKVALYSFFPLSFMFKSRHATASAIGPIVLLYAEQPESSIPICTKNTIKSHLNMPIMYLHINLVHMFLPKSHFLLSPRFLQTLSL